MRSIRLLILTTGLGAGVSLAGCGEPPVEKAPVIRPVKVHTIGSLEPAAMREFPGTIRAFQTAEMGFEVEGRITEFLVSEGDKVEKDAPLARLDATDYEQELNVAQANLEKAEADLARSLSIQEEDAGAISKEEIEEHKRIVAVEQAKLKIAQKAVNDTELRADFSGVMARKLVEDYANVLAKDPVLILQDNSILEVEVAVPERDFVRRKDESESKEEASERLQAKVIVSSLPDREFPARIKEYSTTADPVTRTFAVKLNFDNPDDANILPGMTARVRIVIDPESAWSVPVTAAQADAEEQPYVWKVDAKSMTVSKTPVELGPLTGDRVLLTSGVEEGDLVAISGVTSLREGMQVRKHEN
jgi:RND family efflux transporter MFP subunit